MTNIRVIKGDQLLMNKVPAKIQCRGDLALGLPDGRALKLKDCAFVPSSRHNLVSVSKLLRYYQDGTVVYSQNTIEFKISSKSSSTPILRGTQKNGLYFFSSEDPTGSKKKPLRAQDEVHVAEEDSESDEDPEISVWSGLDSGSESESENKCDSDYFSSHAFKDYEVYGLPDKKPKPNKASKAHPVYPGGMTAEEYYKYKRGWAISLMREKHLQWAHVGRRAMRATIKRDATEMGLTESKLAMVMTITKKEAKCEHCERAKSRRQHPKGKHRRRKHHKREKPIATKHGTVTFDVAGPNPTGKRGERYMFTTVFDDHALSKVAFGKRKSEAPESLKNTLKQWGIECKRRPRIINSDLGELKTKDMKRWCGKHGYRQRFTAANSSSGSAEKKIGTLQTLALASMLWAKAPKQWWVEATKYANDITAMVPSASEKMEGLSPLQSIDETPKMSTTHTWGCLVFANVPETQRKRLSDAGRCGMFLGFAEERSKGYRLYDAETRSFFTSQSIVAFDDTPYLPWWKNTREKRKQRAPLAPPLIEEEEEEEKYPDINEDDEPQEKRKRAQRQMFSPEDIAAAKAVEEAAASVLAEREAARQREQQDAALITLEENQRRWKTSIVRSLHRKQRKPKQPKMTQRTFSASNRKEARRAPNPQRPSSCK